MLNKLRHKILAIGSQIMVRRLSAKVDREQFSVTGCQNPVEAAGLLARERFDMIIVDNLVENVEAICQVVIGIAGAPVTLLLREKPVNWKSLAGLKVDGFLPDTGPNTELMARIRAYIRRKPTEYAGL